ncbi:hypothetical protein HZS_6516 [Henneguya salminicola]|nr:hypothetical protein HZS_6516 [Henneguya salminicola]
MRAFNIKLDKDPFEIIKELREIPSVWKTLPCEEESFKQNLNEEKAKNLPVENFKKFKPNITVRELDNRVIKQNNLSNKNNMVFLNVVTSNELQKVPCISGRSIPTPVSDPIYNPTVKNEPKIYGHDGNQEKIPYVENRPNSCEYYRPFRQNKKKYNGYRYIKPIAEYQNYNTNYYDPNYSPPIPYIPHVYCVAFLDPRYWGQNDSAYVSNSGTLNQIPIPNIDVHPEDISNPIPEPCAVTYARRYDTNETSYQRLLLYKPPEAQGPPPPFESNESKTGVYRYYEPVALCKENEHADLPLSEHIDRIKYGK